MRVLLLGKRSMLGSHLASEMGIRGIDYTWVGYREVMAFMSHDFAAYSHIINCIAYTAVDLAEQDRDEAIEVNIRFVERLAEHAKAANCHLIHYSTDYVFDGKSHFMYDEESESNPLNIYGMTKRDGEWRLLDILPKALIIRTSWLYGFGKGNFVTAILKRMSENRDIKVVDDQIGTSTYAGDLAKASLELLDAQGLIHFANRGVKSRYEWAVAIFNEAKQLNMPLQVENIVPVDSTAFDFQAMRPGFSALSTKKYEEMVRESPRHYREALRDYLINAHQRGELC
ncbi:MAG: dTDP-4-dehydrorhamnose reductase [Simkaniaceae bacterium]|nr:dTDP-4-dehydrorhamnose reductase [Simkaniaceae bacterium]MCF7852405.1 dTDP-4-dehydrorhamnose reductase [Simkaniaceae bacterium]